MSIGSAGAERRSSLQNKNHFGEHNLLLEGRTAPAALPF
jgi:hypothetical protein